MRQNLLSKGRTMKGKVKFSAISLCFLLTACNNTMFIPNIPLETYDVYIDETSADHVLQTFGTGPGVINEPRMDTHNGEDGMSQCIRYLGGVKSGLNLCINKNKFRECHALDQYYDEIQQIDFYFFNGILKKVDIGRYVAGHRNLSKFSYISPEWQKHAFPPSEKGIPVNIITNQHYKGE